MPVDTVISAAFWIASILILASCLISFDAYRRWLRMDFD